MNDIKIWSGRRKMKAKERKRTRLGPSIRALPQAPEERDKQGHKGNEKRVSHLKEKNSRLFSFHFVLFG